MMSAQLLRNTLLGALLLGSLASCGSTKLYRQNREALATARSSYDAGRTQQAAVQAEELLAELKPVAKDYPLQMLYASDLIASAHISHSLGEPFLTAPGARLGSRDAAQVAHLVASLWSTHFGRAVQRRALSSKTKIDGEELLPETMAGRDAAATAMRLDLMELYVNARLGFASRVEGLAGAHPEWSQYESAFAATQASELDPALRAWVLYALFEHLAERDPIEAYKFGVAAREQEQVLGRERSQAIVGWIVDHPQWVWRSSAGHEFDPGRDRCPDSGEPNLEFVAYSR